MPQAKVKVAFRNSLIAGKATPTRRDAGRPPTVTHVPESRDLDLVAGQKPRGVDDPQFPVQVGDWHPEARGRLLAGVPEVPDGGSQLGHLGDEAGAFSAGRSLASRVVMSRTERSGFPALVTGISTARPPAKV